MTLPSVQRCHGAAAARFLPHPAGRGGALVLAVAVGLAPVTVHAEPEPTPTATDEPEDPEGDTPAKTQADRAMEAYERGKQNYNLAQYEAALADFKEAASLYASPDFQYNIGLCYEKLDKYDEAIRAFATYLRAKPDAEDRPNVENRIRELQSDLERQQREAEEAAAKQPPPEPESDPAPDPDPDPAPAPTGKEGRALVIAGATLAGVGAALALGGGIGFGVAAGDQAFLLDEIQSDGNPEELSFAEAEQIDADGRRFEALQVGTAAAGSVIAVTGVVLLTLGLRKRSAAAKTQARMGPWLGPRRAAGLTLTGRF